MINYLIIASDKLNNHITVLCEKELENTIRVSSIQDKFGTELYDDYEIDLPVVYSDFTFCGGQKVKKGSIIKKDDLIGLI